MLELHEDVHEASEITLWPRGPTGEATKGAALGLSRREDLGWAGTGWAGGGGGGWGSPSDSEAGCSALTPCFCCWHAPSVAVAAGTR